MLYLRKTHTEASPKAISRRTSYLRVRLEFLPYPHLIPTLFNGCGFGPPLPLTAASTWTWIDHPVSGLPILTVALLRLGFPSAPHLKCLTLPVQVTRRTVLQKVRGCTYKAIAAFLGTGLTCFATFISLRVTLSAHAADLPAAHLLRLHRYFHSRPMLSPCVPTVLFICGTGI